MYIAVLCVCLLGQGISKDSPGKFSGKNGICFAKKKVKFVSGTTQKENFFKNIMSSDQAMTFLLPGSGEKKDEIFDLNKCHHEFPFDRDIDGF